MARFLRLRLAGQLCQELHLTQSELWAMDARQVGELMAVASGWWDWQAAESERVRREIERDY